MVPVVVLAIIAVVLIKSLMSVVARNEGAGFASLTSDYAPTQSYDPTVELRARVNDDARAFLLSAVPEPVELAPDEPEPGNEQVTITETSR